MQLEHGITSGATSPAQLSPSLSLTVATLCLTYHQYSQQQHTRKLNWHACTRAHMHALVNT